MKPTQEEDRARNKPHRRWWGLFVATLIAALLTPTANAATYTTVSEVIAAGTTSSPATIVVLGDSISFGAGPTGNSYPKFSTSWPGQLRSVLNERSYGNAGTGFVSANAAVHATPSYDPRWTFGSGTSDVPYGLHRVGAYEIADGTSASFRCTASCRTFTAYTMDGSGTPSFTVDRHPVTATALDGYPSPQHVYRIPAGMSGIHTLEVTARGGSVRWFGVDAATGTGRVRVSNASISGRSLRTLGDGSDPRYGLPIADAVLKATPGKTVAVIALGVNDWQAGEPTDEVTYYLNRLIDRVRADGAVPFLYVPPQPSPVLQPAGGPTFTAYAATYAQVAAAQKVRFLNHRRLYAPTLTDEQAIYDAGRALGMYADTVHPTDLGSTYMVAGYTGTPGIRASLGIS